MIETIEIKHSVIEGAIGQAAFLAQQHYNKSGKGHRKVTRASFVDGKILVEYENLPKKQEGKDSEKTCASSPSKEDNGDESSMGNARSTSRTKNRKPGRPKKNVG